MVVGDAYVFPGFLTPVLTQLFFPKPPTAFLTYFCRGERREYAGKKSCLNRGSNSQPSGHESDTLTTEPPGRGFLSFWSQASIVLTTEYSLLPYNSQPTDCAVYPRTPINLVANEVNLERKVCSTLDSNVRPPQH